METCATDNNGSYSASVTACDEAALIAIEPTLTDAGTRLAVGSTASGYGIQVIANRGTVVAAAATDTAPPIFATVGANGASYTLVRAAAGGTTRACTLGAGASNGGCTGGTW